MSSEATQPHGTQDARDDNGIFITEFMVPPKLSDGDLLTPFQFEVFNGDKLFFFFGRYNSRKDTIEFILAGQVGTGYKLSMSDGNIPYGWKVKRHGMTKSNANDLKAMDAAFAKSGSGDGVPEDREEKEKAINMAFETEDVISVPHALMRSSGRLGIMDAKFECVGPISFYGPSLPEFFCRCKLKVIVYDEEEVQRRAQENAQTDDNGRSNSRTEANSQTSTGQNESNEKADQPSSPTWMQWAMGATPQQNNPSNGLQKESTNRIDTGKSDKGGDKALPEAKPPGSAIDSPRSNEAMSPETKPKEDPEDDLFGWFGWGSAQEENNYDT